MASRFMQVSGILLMVVSILGFLFSISGIGAVLWYRGNVIDQGEHVLDGMISDLEVAEDSLISTRYVIEQAQRMLDSTRNTVKELSGTLQDLNPMFESMADVIGNDLPDVLGATQSTLDITQESARTVDNLLFALDSISFLSGVSYDPEVTLAESIDHVGESLEDLPGSFSTLEEGILVTGENIDEIGIEINQLEVSMANMDQDFENARQSIQRYELKVEELAGDVEQIREALPRWVNILSACLSFFLFWFGVVQLGLFFQGREMAHAAQERIEK